MNPAELDRFRNLTFEDFKKMAMDPGLKPHEKIGFPSVFRQGYDSHILDDIVTKVSSVNIPGATILDIGCGCGELTQLMIAHCAKLSQTLVVIDSEEVLSQIPDADHVKKVPGQFPSNVNALKAWPADAVICYSVFHYIFGSSDVYNFIEQVLIQLKPGGEFFLGDIPNVSKRNRFLQTPAGEAFHQQLMNTTEKPNAKSISFESGRMDDGFLMGLVLRYRNFGFETYLLPQSESLPLANSRDDLLIRKPK